MKFYKLLSISLFILSIGAIFSNSSKSNEYYTEEFITSNGSLVSIKEDNKLYDKYLELSYNLDKLEVQLNNNQLNFFIATDEGADKEMVVIKGEDELLMLSSDINSGKMPYKLLKEKVEKGTISEAQYSSIVSSLNEGIL